eukprot:GHRR01004657.1.p1 GENE.GHRR01004657.1~~GHRR01004657.1.p1  ORF type:complete len:106 (+),score=21.98 GHRR01004657.1:134-451(+)
MVYAATVRAGKYTFPAKYGWFLAGWAYLCTWKNTPQAGMREVSMEEWNATPAEYLLHPQLHPKLFSRFPEDSDVENKREMLFKKHGYKDHDPSHPLGQAGGNGHH